MPDIVEKPEEEIKPDASGKFPETVPWSKYVGIKESLGKKLDTATSKVATLEDQLTKAPNAEEHTKIAAELAQLKKEHETAVGELKAIKDKSVSEKRSTLTSKGVPEATVKDLSEKELDAVLVALGNAKPQTPKPDFGGGAGGNNPSLTAKDRIRQGFQSLHPS